MRRILVLSRRNILNPLAGGASRYVHEIFRRLTDSFEITILCGSEKTEKNEVQSIDGLNYVTVQGGLTRARLPFNYLARYRTNADLLVDHADVALPWFSPLFATIPRITIIHQLVREIFYHELPTIFAGVGFFLEPAIYRLYSRSTIVAVSNSTARDLFRSGVPPSRVHVISPGSPASVAEPVPLMQRSQRLIGCVSRLMNYKGVQFAISALGDLVEQIPDVRLEIAGSGPRDRQLRRLAESMGLGSNVTFLGGVSEERKTKLYCESRVVVSPSVREGYGISVIEANSMGTPVVGWNVPGLRDSVLHNTTGLLATYPDHKEMAKLIRSLLMDDETWNRLSQNAWKWAGSHSWDRSAELFKKVIEMVLPRSG